MKKLTALLPFLFPVSLLASWVSWIELNEKALEGADSTDVSGLIALVEDDDPVKYNGAWNDWHIFTFCDYFGEDEVGHAWGWFSLRKDRVSIEEESTIDVSNKSRIHGFEGRAIVSIDSESHSLQLGPHIPNDIDWSSDALNGKLEQDTSLNGDKPLE